MSRTKHSAAEKINAVERWLLDVDESTTVVFLHCLS